MPRKKKVITEPIVDEVTIENEVPEEEVVVEKPAPDPVVEKVVTQVSKANPSECGKCKFTFGGGFCRTCLVYKNKGDK